MVKDLLNSKFGLPSIGDYYYDAPDILRFYEGLDKDINPVRRDNNGIVARDYYCEEPPPLGHDATNLAYTFGVSAPKTAVADNEFLGVIKIDDGDTISIPLASIQTGDEDSKNYITMAGQSAIEDGVNNARVTIRFACMDCKELPHFASAGNVSQLEKFETKTLTYDEAEKNGYFVSKYKSFMDEPEKISKTYDGKEVNGTFYKYDRELDKINIMKLNNGTWRQYFDKDGIRYILVKADCNDYTQETIADAGVARDTLINAMSKAEEIRFVIDETALNRDKRAIKTMYKTKPFEDSAGNSLSALLDSFFDKYTQYKNAGFNYYGLDYYGRMIGAVYAKYKNPDGSEYWVNLNKMVIANSNTTDVNKYEAPGAGTPVIDSASYGRLDEKSYADAIYDQSKQWDDRKEVQESIFQSLGKEYNDKFKNWTVTIGDVSLFVPPTSIRCISQTKAERLPLVRAKGAMAKSSTKVQRIIEMTLYFNDEHGINGFPYKTKTGMAKNGKEATYYMNGLRALYAQFRLAPFLPIDNTYINEVLGVDAVYMVNFSCSTVPGFPKLLQVTLQMAEFEYRVYMPEIPIEDEESASDEHRQEKGWRNYFSKQINYPLFRYYYQRAINRGEELKDTNFMDEKYIESTFGNKTALVPMKFMNPYVKFYIPNRAQLEQMLETKKERLTMPVTEDFTEESFAFAKDVEGIKNEIDYLQDDKFNPATEINSFIKSLNGKHISPSVNGLDNTKAGPRIYNNDGSEDKEATNKLYSLAGYYANTYAQALADLKNTNGESLVGGDVKADVHYINRDSNIAYQETEEKDYVVIDAIVPINAQYLSENELNKIRTMCSTVSVDSVNEIMPGRTVRVGIKMPVDSNQKALLGEGCNGFALDREGDYAALDYLAKVLPLHSNKGNDASNAVKRRIDYTDPGAIKFDAYNDEQAFLVEAMTLGTSNSFTQITLQEMNGFAPQYMGGTDINLTISLFTKNKEAAKALTRLPSLAAEYAREYRLVLSAWPLRIESELTKFFGVTEVLIENAEVDTVPNYPGVYHVTMSLVSVDRTLRNRESLKQKDMKNFHSITKEGVAYERHLTYPMFNKFLSEAELYPDLELPTLDELESAGFKFIRYSNKDRVYPDPDFYYTYAYVLTSQIIRETVLQGLNAGEILMVDEATGKHITGYAGDVVGELAKQMELEKGWNKKIENEFENSDDMLVARVISDFSKSLDKERDEVWTIAPNVKVALCEKRITNHINDYEKRKDREKQEERFTEASAEKLQQIKVSINDKIDSALSQKIEDFDIQEVSNAITKSFNTLEGDGSVDTQFIGSAIDTWLTAAADAICSYGNVVYSSNLEDTKDGKAPWKYKDKYRARVDKNGCWEDIEFDRSDANYKENLSLVKYNSIRFGYFDFKYYDKEELEARFGCYGATDGKITEVIDYIPAEVAAKGAVPRALYGDIYLADPLYRFADAKTQVEYIEKCTTNFSYAKKAFYRICLLYLKVLVSYDILPSFSYDVFREAVMNKERMEKILKQLEGKRSEEEKAIQKQQQEQKKRATQTTRYEKGESNDTQNSDDNASQSADNNENKESKETSSSVQIESVAVEKYQQEFRKNREAIDRGKIFLALAMGIVDGNRDFLKILLKRDYDAMQAISTAAMKNASLLGGSNGSSKYMPKIVAFIRAMGGEDVIEERYIGAGDSSGPASVFMQVQGRKNIAAAAADPETYLIHSFYDMIVHDCRGRMLRAFPTFYMVLIDEGRKVGNFRLHDNFYNTSSISSISIAQSRKIPTDTAEIVMSNFFKTYSTDDEDLNMNYTANYTDVFNSIWIPTLQSYAEKEEQKRQNAMSVERIHLRPGARVHLRLGYGADASHLPISFNGMVAELETGDVVKLICQSDGAELAKPILMDRQAYELPGVDEWIGLSTMGENGATPKSIMNTLMNCHDGKIPSLIHENGWDEAASFININTNPLGIYHFGSPDVEHGGEKETMQNIFEVGVTNTYDRYINLKKKNEASTSEVVGGAIAGGVTGYAIGATTVLGVAALTGLTIATGGTALALAAGAAGAAVGGSAMSDAGGLSGALDSIKETANSYKNDILGQADVVPRINFDVFGKTVWDVAHICKSLEPEYICGISPFHLRSTLFIGRPNDYYAYDYAVGEGAWMELRKPYQQYHIYTSYTDIINNNIAVSTKDMRTCAVGLYEVDGFMNAKVQKRTDPQWVDACIYPEYQKTMYVDTKLYGVASRKLGVLSDVGNFFSNGIFNSFFDRSFDDEGDVKSHHRTAVKMTRDALKTAMKEMYQGRMTIIGDPSVKPHDRICITDVYNGITGQCLVRDVVQVFSADDGYKTVITPDLITAQTGSDAENEMKRQHLGNICMNFVAGALTYTLAMAMINKEGLFAVREALKANAAGAVKAAKDVVSGATKTKTMQGLISAEKKLKTILQDIKGAESITSALKGTWEAAKVVSAPFKLLAKLKGGPAGIIACTLGLGTLTDMLEGYVEGRKCLVVFPLQKYNRPMVGGMDGSVGTIYGSPNFSTKDALQKAFSWAEGPLKYILPGVADAFEKQTEGKVNNSEAMVQKTINEVNRSHIAGHFGKAYFNPSKPRYDVSQKKASDYKSIIAQYAVKSNTELDIRDDPNFKQGMMPVIRDARLKRFFDLGYFRVIAYDKGFTEALSSQIKCMYLPDPETSGYIPVNAIIREDNNVDVPYLHKDALGVLCEIIRQSYLKLSGTENERDANEWYEKNKSKIVTLTSALICGALTRPDGRASYEATGFSFVLTTTDDKVTDAIHAAIESINKQMEDTNKKTERVPKAVMSEQIKGNDISIMVHPPKG